MSLWLKFQKREKMFCLRLCWNSSSFFCNISSLFRPCCHGLPTSLLELYGVWLQPHSMTCFTHNMHIHKHTCAWSFLSRLLLLLYRFFQLETIYVSAFLLSNLSSCSSNKKELPLQPCVLFIVLLSPLSRFVFVSLCVLFSKWVQYECVCLLEFDI